MSFSEQNRLASCMAQQFHCIALRYALHESNTTLSAGNTKEAIAGVTLALPLHFLPIFHGPFLHILTTTTTCALPMEISIFPASRSTSNSWSQGSIHPMADSPSPGGADPRKSIPHRGGGCFFGANELRIHLFLTEVILLTSDNLPWKFAPKSQCFAQICRKTAQYLWHKISPLSSNLSKQNWVIRAQLTTQIPDFITKLTNSYVASISMYI